MISKLGADVQCLPADPDPEAPVVTIPTSACDSHAHVCGPTSRYDYIDQRIYTPPDALLTDYRAMLDALGIERGVLVQPSIYGTDNQAMEDALRQDPQHLRGVAVVH